VELSLLTNRSRSDGDWSTSIAPKAKWNIVPTGIGRFGFAFYAGGSFDALTRQSTAFAVVPATYRLSETMRININAGGCGTARSTGITLTYGWASTGNSPMFLQLTVRRSGRPAHRMSQAWSGPGFRRGALPAHEIFSVRCHLRRNITAKMPNWLTIGPRSGFRRRKLDMGSGQFVRVFKPLDRFERRRKPDRGPIVSQLHFRR